MDQLKFNLQKLNEAYRANPPKPVVLTEDREVEIEMELSARFLDSFIDA